MAHGTFFSSETSKFAFLCIGKTTLLFNNFVRLLNRKKFKLPCREIHARDFAFKDFNSFLFTSLQLRFDQSNDVMLL